ncbi:MAG: hypothetical protein ACLR9W_08070 [Enterobacter hormaechei]
MNKQSRQHAGNQPGQQRRVSGRKEEDRFDSREHRKKRNAEKTCSAS